MRIFQSIDMGLVLPTTVECMLNASVDRNEAGFINTPTSQGVPEASQLSGLSCW